MISKDNNVLSLIVRVLLLAFILTISSCGRGGGSLNSEVADPVRVTASYDLAGSVRVSWSSIDGAKGDIYYSSEDDFDHSTYSNYENSGLLVSASSPATIELPCAAERYYIKVVAKSNGNESEPSSTSVATRFWIDKNDTSVFLDVSSGLTWNRCSDGQDWDSLAEECTGTANVYNPTEASQKFGRATLDVRRVPSESEVRAVTPEPEITTLFRGSTRAHYDATVFRPIRRDGIPFVSTHTFDGVNSGISVSVNDDLAVHIVLVLDPPHLPPACR